MTDQSKEFWTGPRAKDYPFALRLGEGEGVFMERLAADQRGSIGEWMREEGLIPQAGQILDLGAGPCSKLIFGDDVAASRVTAVDFSEGLLAKGGVPQENWLVADLRKIDFPGDWKGKFELVVAILLFRYLKMGERLRLLDQVAPLLVSGGKIVAVDFGPRQVNEAVVRELGEVEDFDVNKVAGLLRRAGYKDIRLGGRDYLLEGGMEPEPFSFSYVYGQR